MEKIFIVQATNAGNKCFKDYDSAAVQAKKYAGQAGSNGQYDWGIFELTAYAVSPVPAVEIVKL